MYGWKWEWYVTRLRGKGYDVRERRDSKGVLRGYTLRKGNVIIKASELRGRAFMVSRLEDTWRKLNAQKRTDTTTQRTTRTTTGTSSIQADESTRTLRMPTQQPQSTLQQSNRTTSSTSQSSAQSSVPRVVANPTQNSVPTPKPNYATFIDYTRYRPDTIPYTLELDGKERRYYIPEKIMDLFNDEFDYREIANWQELTNLAVALFIGMGGGPATAPLGGGGGSPINNNWGRDKDEDDLHWARCCARMVMNIKPPLKRGLHR